MSIVASQKCQKKYYFTVQRLGILVFLYCLKHKEAGIYCNILHKGMINVGNKQKIFTQVNSELYDLTN